MKPSQINLFDLPERKKPVSDPHRYTGMFMSDRHDWGTPDYIFDTLHKEFQFDLDAAASKPNAKCDRYLDKEADSLASDWSRLSSSCVWLNPPYGRTIGKWMEKAHNESLRGCKVVCLIFARTDTAWWHDYVSKAYEVRLIRGRINFIDPQTGLKGKTGSVAPSALIIYKKSDRVFPVYTHMDFKNELGKRKQSKVQR